VKVEAVWLGSRKHFVVVVLTLPLVAYPLHGQVTSLTEGFRHSAPKVSLSRTIPRWPTDEKRLAAEHPALGSSCSHWTPAAGLALRS
jgi:hypothetical protein